MPDKPKPKGGRANLPDTIGTRSSSFPVELSTRFLKHFSEQLYRSPQKAFEELISNSWDAGASYVDIKIPDDLSDPSASMMVFDNGSSMDDKGLEELWKIAFSSKADAPSLYGRQLIGQFGIGKLATYVLANKLTYVCKDSTGKIRRVTMNYGEIDTQPGSEPDKLISQLQLDMFDVDEDTVHEALTNVYGGDSVSSLISNGVPDVIDDSAKDEYGAPISKLKGPPEGSWTLAILSDLKDAGRELKVGVLKRMLEAALPIGSEMTISMNDELLSSSKIDLPLINSWVIGPDLSINSFELKTENGDSNDTEIIKITSNRTPFPHIDIPEIGKLTGLVRLFQDKISGGKSDVHGPSNGFHVNVLGRLVNQHDSSFGEENLSHAAWARFRMAVRADGLNKFLITNREQFKDCRELRIFRAFLRKVFNKIRREYDSDQMVTMPDGGDVLVKSLGVVSLGPLRNVVSDTLSTQAPIPGLFDETDMGDRADKLESWKKNTSENIKNALDQVKYDKSGQSSFVNYRLSDNSIVINKDHPFVLEHSTSKKEKELLRTIALVSLLTDVYALDIGIDPKHLTSMRDYRDQLMRFKALQRRESGLHIAQLLLSVSNDSNYRKLESVVSDGLRYLGFDVKDLAKPGEPEGIAKAYAIPTYVNPSIHDPNPPLYSFSFDAKSSIHESVSTNNINLAAVVHHRNKYNADYALIIAPEYQEGYLSKQCEEQVVSPMRARDLGMLIKYTVKHGAIPVTKLRDIFAFYHPDEISTWVTNLESWIKGHRKLTLDIFLKALSLLRDQFPDALDASVIAYTCRAQLKIPEVINEDVIAVASGLSILVPDLIGIKDTSKIEVNAKPEKIKQAVESQLERLQS